MELTGENKKQFEKWLETKPQHRNLRQTTGDGTPLPSHWTRVDIEQLIGVYLAYYDSLDIHITTEPTYWNQDDELEWAYSVEVNRVGSGTFTESRNEAYKEAFKKADEIVNKKH